MDTWEAVDGIRVVREFDARDLPEEHVRRILHAGRRAGSSKNSQRWAFVVVRDRKQLQRLAEAGHFAGHVAAAPVTVALLNPDPRAPDAPLSVVWDLGRAAQNMVLVAWELGIGSCPATVYNHALVHDLLQIPEGHHCEYLLAFGYPADPAVLNAPKRAGGRVSLDEVRHEETW